MTCCAPRKASGGGQEVLHVETSRRPRSPWRPARTHTHTHRLSHPMKTHRGYEGGVLTAVSGHLAVGSLCVLSEPESADDPSRCASRSRPRTPTSSPGRRLMLQLISSPRRPPGPSRPRTSRNNAPSRSGVGIGLQLRRQPLPHKAQPFTEGLPRGSLSSLDASRPVSALEPALDGGPRNPKEFRGLLSWDAAVDGGKRL